MNFRTLSFALTLVCFFAPSAFAIDVVRLKNGQVVTGASVDDQATTYVDILLENGEHRLIPKAEVSRIQRGLTSKEDRENFGNDSRGFVSVNLGAAYDMSQYYNQTILFDYGVKVGVIAGQCAYTKFAVAISYDHSSRSLSLGIDGGNETDSTNDLHLEALFTRLGDTGFYFGPNVGLFNRSVTLGSNSAQNQNAFEIGIGGGFETYLSDHFSVGPDLRYEHAFAKSSNPIFQNESPNTLKATVAGNFHF